MSDITTSVTFTLTHARKLTEEEFKNIVTNITEHIFEEHRGDEGDWGFKAITNVHCAAAHQIDGREVMAGPSAEWGALWEKPAAA